MKINISLESKINLTKKWGPEVTLKCSCREVPSHSMWGHYPTPSCPVCKQRCQVIVEDWGVPTDGPSSNERGYE
jgi:hypothetical protein